MARPKKYNADYFSHDKDMRNDLKIKALRKKFGLSGYAFYCMFLEVLVNEDYFEYEINDLSIELLNGDFDIDNGQELLDYCCKLKLFIFDEDRSVYFSESMKNRLEPLVDKRKKDREFVLRKKSEYNKGVNDDAPEETSESSYVSCKRYFEEVYLDKTKVHYSWCEKELKQLNSIVDKLKQIRADNNLQDVDNILNSFKNFINEGLKDEYIAKILTLNIFNKQFTQICSKINHVPVVESKSKKGSDVDYYKNINQLKRKSSDIYSDIVNRHKSVYLESLNGKVMDGKYWSLNVANWDDINEEYKRECIELNLPITEI